MLLAPAQYILEHRDRESGFLAKIVLESYLEQFFGAHLRYDTTSGGGTPELVIMHEEEVAISTFKDIYLKAVNPFFRKVLNGL